MRYIVFMLGLSVATVAAAPVATPVDIRQDLTQPQVKQAEEILQQPIKHPSTSPSMTSEELLGHPDLLQNALDTAVEQQNTENIRFLLPLYRRLTQEKQDTVLVDYAEALLLQSDGQHTEAQQRFHSLLAAHPDYAPIRLQLAHTLSQDGQQREAAAEIGKIRQTSELPPPVITYLDQFGQYLKSERAWKFDAGLSYLQESNVGRVPEQRTYGNWRFSEPKKAHGIGYEFSARKTVPVKGHWAARVQVSGYGKFYWDAHDYDDLILRTETGGVWRSAKRELSLSPFYEKRWYGTEPYSNHVGGVVRYSEILSPQWQFHGAWQSGNKKHDDRKYLDGNNHSLSLSLLQRSSPKQTFIYGIDGGIEQARDDSESYRRYGVRTTWMRDWGQPQALSTSVSFAAQRRHYQAPDFFNIKREDTEYFTRVSASHKKLSWKGFTPRVNWTWSHIHSNHFYYRHDRHRVFLDVTKQF
mgnify:CR=1 FL=1